MVSLVNRRRVAERIGWVTLLTAASLLSLAGEVRAAPSTYNISGEVSSVLGDASPFGGGVLTVGDQLTGTLVYDPDLVFPFLSLEMTVATNTYQLTFNTGTVAQETGLGVYRMGYNNGSANPSGLEQWRTNGVDTLVEWGNGSSSVLFWDEDDFNAPTLPRLRDLDSPLWEDFNIGFLESFTDAAFFTNESIVMAPIPEPTTGSLVLLGLLGLASRRRGRTTNTR